MTEPVIDVSGSYQGVVNWQVEKNAGVVLGICKASEGLSWNDPQFVTSWAALKSLGMKRGAYHFGHPANNPVDEVNHFLSRVGGDIIPGDTFWLDIEANDGRPGAAAWALVFMNDLASRLPNNNVGVYTGKWFIDANGGPGAWTGLTKWGLWMSMYQSTLPTPIDLAPWSECVLWQNTSSSRQPGVNGVCDASIIVNGGYFTAGWNGKPTQQGGQVVSKPGVKAIYTKDGGGYWCIDNDGGVQTFGDAQFYGSLGGQVLQQPIVDAARSGTGLGYYMVAADGGVFCFGDAQFHGSLAGIAIAAPIVGIAVKPDDSGYVMFGADNGVYASGSSGPFGNVQYLGRPA